MTTQATAEAVEAMVMYLRNGAVYDYQTGHPLDMSGTMDEAADIIEKQAASLAASQQEVVMLRGAAEVVLSNEEHAFSAGLRKYQKGSPTWQAYEDLRKAIN